MGVFRPVSPQGNNGRFPEEQLDFKSGCTFFTPQRISGAIVRKSDKVTGKVVSAHCYKP
jgi:hypothetical protein